MPTKKAPAKKAATKVAKKVTKKAAPKKPAAKKVVAKKKTTTKKPVAKTSTAKRVQKSPKEPTYASNEQSFWVTNGEILNSLVALHHALDTMPKEVFEFHAFGPQNDFSVWVETVLCDADCAADLAKAKSQKTAKTAVAKHLKHYAQ